jgi:hypothetical protein
MIVSNPVTVSTPLRAIPPRSHFIPTRRGAVGHAQRPDLHVREDLGGEQVEVIEVG